MTLTHFDIEPSGCPFCGHLLDAVASMGPSAGPKEGDATFCIQCHALMIFGPGMKMRAATAEEAAELFENEQTARLSEALRQSQGHTRQ